MIAEQIEEKGEQIVGSWLKSNGYFRIVLHEKKSEIEADSGMRRIFVYIKTTLNNKNEKLSKDEIKLIKSNAIKRNREPWLAIVKIQCDNQSNHIQWKNLSK